ncbi:sulfotransferase 1B1-like [Saccostrea cucullata]|uniref:sulfotransferase 1B1-like n=1 Tax=Saccostrea cuccullata TaxID=36930 RepID=UPI002ED271FE
MPIVKVADDAGDMMSLLEVNGRYFPILRTPHDQEEELRNMTSWKARSDDVLICAYPKSGTHWVWEIVKMILDQKAVRIPSMKESAMLECGSGFALQNMLSPRVLNTHMLFSDIPKDFVDKRCKMIYVLRNPKDVAVSFYNHHVRLLDYEYSGSWRSYLGRFLYGKVDYGSWFDYVLHWEKSMKTSPDLPFHTLTYESLHQSPEHEIRNLAEFLAVSCSSDLSHDISAQCSFLVMKEEKDPLEDITEWKDGEPGMYRKGCVGDWRNWFTVAQNELFTAVYEQKMAESTITPVYTLNNEQS